MAFPNPHARSTLDRSDPAIGKPWLSVVMPCRNGERWLGAALRSVLEQQQPAIEIVFVDGSDSDRSRAIAESFSDRLDIRIHHRPDLRSWMAKTNFAVSAARAEWISVLHVDDLWLPGRCAALQKWLATGPDAVMHLHPSYIIDESGKKLGLWRCPLPSAEAPLPAVLLLQRLLVQNFIAIPAPVIRRDAFLAVGGLDEALWHTADWDLYLKISAVGNVHYHPEPLVAFRIHEQSLTVSGSRSIEDFRQQLAIVPHRYADRLPAGLRRSTLALAVASAAVNTALAEANNGNPAALGKAVLAILALGPRQIPRYLHYSRIAERLVPRLRARFSGEI